MKIALIGAGGMGTVHSQIYKTLSEIEVVAIVDIDKKKANRIAEVHCAKVYESIEEMLKFEKPDIIDICTPTYLHSEMTIKAMESKINVLCEKPLSLGLTGAQEMIDAAERNNIFFMVGQVIRFWPEYSYLKKAYVEDTYGRLKQISFSRISARPDWSWEDWMMDSQKSGRAPIDLHIHDTDFILFLLGKPKAVKSTAIEDGNVISYITTQYIYENIVVTAEGGWYDSPIPFSMSYRAVFEKAVLEYKDNLLTVYPSGGEKFRVSSENQKLVDAGINISTTNGYYDEIKYFIHCIKNNEPIEMITPQGAMDSLRVVLKEVESANSGETVIL